MATISRTDYFPQHPMTILAGFTKQKECFAWPDLIAQLAKATGSAPAWLTTVGNYCGAVKNTFSFANIPMDLLEISRSVVKCYDVFDNRKTLFNAEGKAAGRDVIRKTTGLIKDSCDGLRLQAWLFGTRLAGRVSGISSGATVIGSLVALVDDVDKLWRGTNLTTEHKIQYGLGIFTNVCFIIVGSAGLYAYYAGVAVSRFVLLPLTAGLTLSTMQYFYTRIWDPERKHPDPIQTAEALRQARGSDRAPNPPSGRVGGSGYIIDENAGPDKLAGAAASAASSSAVQEKDPAVELAGKPVEKDAGPKDVPVASSAAPSSVKPGGDSPVNGAQQPGSAHPLPNDNDLDV